MLRDLVAELRFSNKKPVDEQVLPSCSTTVLSDVSRLDYFMHSVRSHGTFESQTFPLFESHYITDALLAAFRNHLLQNGSYLFPSRLFKELDSILTRQLKTSKKPQASKGYTLFPLAVQSSLIAPDVAAFSFTRWALLQKAKSDNPVFREAIASFRYSISHSSNSSRPHVIASSVMNYILEESENFVSDLSNSPELTNAEDINRFAIEEISALLQECIVSTEAESVPLLPFTSALEQIVIPLLTNQRTHAVGQKIAHSLFSCLSSTEKPFVSVRDEKSAMNMLFSLSVFVRSVSFSGRASANYVLDLDVSNVLLNLICTFPSEYMPHALAIVLEVAPGQIAAQVINLLSERKIMEENLARELRKAFAEPRKDLCSLSREGFTRDEKDIMEFCEQAILGGSEAVRVGRSRLRKMDESCAAEGHSLSVDVPIEFWVLAVARHIPFMSSTEQEAVFSSIVEMIETGIIPGPTVKPQLQHMPVQQNSRARALVCAVRLIFRSFGVILYVLDGSTREKISFDALPRCMSTICSWTWREVSCEKSCGVLGDVMCSMLRIGLRYGKEFNEELQKNVCDTIIILLLKLAGLLSQKKASDRDGVLKLVREDVKYALDQEWLLPPVASALLRLLEES